MVDPDMPPSLKICSMCKDAADCCVGEGGAAATKDLCCQPPNSILPMYSSNGHCCAKGFSWDGVSCEHSEPCYSSSSNPLYCNFLAPNYANPTSWWSDTILCNRIATSQACCWVSDGLFGYVSIDSFYHWHTLQDVTVY
jgi:hypothetical protein